MRTVLAFALFLGIILLVLTGIHYYIGSRIVAWLQPPRPWSVRLRVALVALGYSIIVARLLERRLPTAYCLLWWAAAVWMGLAFYLLLFLALGHLVEAVVKLAGRWPSDRARNLTVGLAMAAAFVAAAVALVQGLRAPRLTELEVALPGLPGEADGLTVVQLSDLHIGAIVGPGRVRALVDTSNALEPDLVVITGDLVDEHADGLGRFEEHLARLEAPLGVYAVTGNHEFIHGVAPARALMQRTGIRLLENEAAQPVEGLRVVGLHDSLGHGFGAESLRLSPEDTERLLSGHPGRPTILLYHQPVKAERFAELGVDLMLAGHTHVGQIWPFGLLQKLFYPRNYGLYEVGAMTMYVTSGTGTWGPPMRLGTRSEMVRLTLRAWGQDGGRGDPGVSPGE